MENATMKTPKDFAPELAAALTLATGNAWTAEPARDYEHYREVWQGDGAGVRLGIGTGAWNEKDKFSISGTFNHITGSDGKPATPYNLTRPSMKVGRAKSAEQIAKDVVRRILSDVAIATQDCKIRAAESKAHGQGVMGTAQRIAALVGAKVTTDRNSGDPATARIDLYRSAMLPECLGDLRPSDGGVTFEHFSVTEAEAAAMLAALVKVRTGVVFQDIK